MRRPGSARIQASSVTDPRHTGSGTLMVAGQTTAEISGRIEAVTEVGTRNVVPHDRISGVVDVHVVANVPPGSYEIRLMTDSGVVLASRVHAGSTAWLPLTIDTQALPVGVMQVQVWLMEQGNPLAISHPQQMTVVRE